MDITKAELMEKYEISENVLSMVVAKIKPTGTRMVNRHKLKLFDEEEAAKEILELLRARKDLAQSAYDDARGRYMRAFEIARASGLIDNPRWRL